MKKRTILSCLIAVFLILALVAQVLAITGRLGNSRVVLRLDDGESVRRSIAVYNINEVPLTIDLLASGDLAENVESEENGFVLQPGEEKDVYFTITAEGAGTKETKLNVRFTPPSGSGVGLSANIIVITGDEGSEDENDSSDTEDEGSVVEDDENGGFIFNPSGQESQTQDATSGDSKMSPVTMLILSTVALIIIFIILVVYSNKMRKKKGSRRPRE